jgi:spermidine-citrate ligase
MTPPVDALAAATAAHSEALVNCYLREAAPNQVGETGGELVLPLAGGLRVVVGVRYRSRTFRHRYRWPAQLVTADGATSDLDFPLLAALLLRELHRDGHAAAPATLLARMLESLDNVAGFLAPRRDEVDRLWSAAPLGFVDSEQALLLGHPLHPTPKSRSEMSPADRRTYSPETRGRFRLHWLAVQPDLVRHASALGPSAPELFEKLCRDDLEAEPLAGLGERVLLPAHPWELEHLRHDPAVAALLDSGAVRDLGPLGSPVTPTTSVRTVCRAGWPWQLKFSLHVRVTNSLRVTLPKELDRAVEAARLSRTEVGRQAGEIAPTFRFVHDPAYLTVQAGGTVLDGFSVLLRENPWPADADVTAVTTLCQDHPFGGISRLGAIVGRLAERDGRRPDEVARAWFARFLDVAVVSLVRLYADLGLCFEPHQQNTLLELDADGFPERCAYRDSQGYFHRELAHADLVRVIPGLGEASESIFPEDLADERLVYYPFMNLTLGVVNALGAAGVAGGGEGVDGHVIDEGVLLGDLRRCLEAERARPTRYPTTLLDRLLDDERWPCKGNLRTRYHDMDELVGDIETQSVYVTVPNPLVAVS